MLSAETAEPRVSGLSLGCADYWAKIVGSERRMRCGDGGMWRSSTWRTYRLTRRLPAPIVRGSSSLDPADDTTIIRLWRVCSGDDTL